MFYSDLGIYLQIIGFIIFIPKVRLFLIMFWFGMYIEYIIRKKTKKNKIKITAIEKNKLTQKILQDLFEDIEKSDFSIDDFLLTKKGIIIGLFAICFIISGLILQHSFFNPYPPTIVFNF